MLPLRPNCNKCVARLCDCSCGRAVCRLGMWRFAPARTDSGQARPKRAAPAVPDHARLYCSCFSLGKLCLCADAAEG